MKASELRIGNWVSREDLFDRSPRDTQIIFLGEKATVTGPIKVICEYEDLTGIPLSEEWLLNIGFTKYEWCMDCAFIKFQGQHLMARYYSGKWHITKTRVEVDSGGQHTNGHKYIVKTGLIKHVHQLQNLYFALTGEELTTQNATASDTLKQNQ